MRETRRFALHKATQVDAAVASHLREKLPEQIVGVSMEK